MSTSTIVSYCERCGVQASPPQPAQAPIGLLDRLLPTSRPTPVAQPTEPLRLCLGCRDYICAACMNDDAGLCSDCAPRPAKTTPVPYPEATGPLVALATPALAAPPVELAPPPPPAMAEVEPPPPAMEIAPPPPPAMAEFEPPPPAMEIAPPPPPAMAEVEPPPPAMAEVEPPPPAMAEVEPPPPAMEIAPPPPPLVAEPPAVIESVRLRPAIDFARPAPRPTARHVDRPTPVPPLFSAAIGTPSPGQSGRVCLRCDLALSTHAAFCRRCGHAQPRVA